MEDNIENKKYIYILFLTTSTKIGKIIRLITRYRYNHVAISLDKDLNNMYGFARYRKNVPLVGGFTQESKLRYFETDEVGVKVCEIEVDEEKYNDIIKYIEEMKKHKKEYMYNIFSAMAFPIHRKVKIKNSYICLEFIIHLLSKFNIEPELKEENFYTIKQLEKILSDKCFFEGKLNELVKPNNWGDDEYIKEETFREATIDTIAQVGKLINRKISN
ncbi:MAG: hypothetical protein Q4G05_06605 [Clostridia bacterium]|nr:hypothetical protein [Clostridia bacterium]